jgi:rubrerythrin
MTYEAKIEEKRWYFWDCPVCGFQHTDFERRERAKCERCGQEITFK